jgi:nucleoside-diphosphate-sugar epimerase
MGQRASGETRKGGRRQALSVCLAGDYMVDETSPLNPVTPYGDSKMKAERGIVLATAYGVSPRMRFDIVLNNLTAFAVTRGAVYLKSDGTPWRPIAHIEDISRAFIAALEAPWEAVFNEVFNVGSTAQNYRMHEIAEIVASVVPGCRIEMALDAGPDKRSYRVSFEKVSRVLPAFKPKWDAQLGAEELYSAYQLAGLVLEEFEGPRYQRISHIQQLIRDGILTSDLRHSRAVPARKSTLHDRQRAIM